MKLSVLCRRGLRQGSWLLSTLWCCSTLSGAEAPAFSTTVSRHSYDIWPLEAGWQPNTVTSLMQSQDGYLWLGTYNGLVRFDGVSLTVFDSGNTPGLPNSRITALHQDPRGVIWIGHETGELTQFAARRFTAIDLGARWPKGAAIEALNTDEQGDLWLLNDRGILFRLRDGETLESPGGGSATRKTLLTRDQEGELWIAANGMVRKLEGGRAVAFQFGQTNDSDFYQAVLPARDGGLWAVVNGAVRKFRDGRWELDLGQYPGAQSPVTALWETRAGTVLAGTLNEGLYLLAPGVAPLHFSRTNGLSHDWVRSVCEDHEGNIWIGTGAGLDTLRPRRLKMFNAPDAWQGRAVLSLVAPPDGSAWIGTEGAGLYRYTEGSWKAFTESSGLKNLFVWSVLASRRGELFVGTWGGGSQVRNGERFETQGEMNQIPAAVLALYEGQQGELWVGTTSGLFRYEGGKVTWSAGEKELAFPNVRSITQTEDGTLWFGMLGGGLGSLKNGKLNQYRKRDGLSSDFVQCLHAEADGTLWMGTADNGLVRWRQGKFAAVRPEQGLPTGIISHLVDDGAGNLWMGSHRGILRASKLDLERCANGEIKAVHCLSYGRAEGLASENCSGGFQPGACKTAEGLLWFPTVKGVAIVDPLNVTTNKVAPPVVIEELLVEGERVQQSAGASTLKIAPGKQRFEIRYTGLSFVAPEKVRFRYKLEGLEREWMEAGSRRVAEYSYLPPATYDFRVMACNNDDVWNEAGASLAFSVMPWFWQTWWFRTGALLAGAAAVGTVVLLVTRRRVRVRLQQLERQRAVERERARIARDIHDDLGASLTRITMLSQSVRAELDNQQQAASDVDEIYGTARELTRAMDEIVWAVNPKHDTVDSLVTYLGRFAQSFLSSAGIRCRIDVPVHLPAWSLTAESRHNVFLAFKEALHNVVKHARASEVRISLEVLSHGFVLLIADNGCGFDLNGFKEAAKDAGDARLACGNGLLNMRKRLEEINGDCEWETSPGEGTRVKFVLSAKV